MGGNGESTRRSKVQWSYGCEESSNGMTAAVAREHDEGQRRWRSARLRSCTARARARRGRESERERVSERDVAPFSARSSLIGGSIASGRPPCSERVLAPVGHDGA